MKESKQERQKGNEEKAESAAFEARPALNRAGPSASVTAAGSWSGSFYGLDSFAMTPPASAMNPLLGPALISTPFRSPVRGRWTSGFLSRSQPLSILTCASPIPYRLPPYTQRTMSTAAPSTESDPRPVFFFDIDNCVGGPNSYLLRGCALTLTVPLSFTAEVRNSILRRYHWKDRILTRRLLECNIFGHMQTLISKSPYRQPD